MEVMPTKTSFETSRSEDGTSSISQVILVANDNGKNEKLKSGISNDGIHPVIHKTQTANIVM